MLCHSKPFRGRYSKGQGNAKGNTMAEGTLAEKDKLTSRTLLSDQRGAVAFEMPIVFGFMMFLLLCMFSLPIKMVLRWTFNLKYIVAIPEYFFNI